MPLEKGGGHRESRAQEDGGGTAGAGRGGAAGGAVKAVSKIIATSYLLENKY